MYSLYHDDSYDPRELLEEYAADQRSTGSNVHREIDAAMGYDPEGYYADGIDWSKVTIYDDDVNGTVLGHARKTTNRFNKTVYYGYWSDSSNVPIKEKRWNRSFSSVEEVARYMRAWKGAR